jgi:hypothetical protein
MPLKERDLGHFDQMIDLFSLLFVSEIGALIIYVAVV